MEEPPPSAFDNYLPIPDPEAFPSALSLLKELHSSTSTQWTSNGTKNSVTLSQHQPDPPLPAPITRGEGHFPAGYTPEQILSVVHTPACRKYWDDRFQVGFPTARYTRNIVRFYAVQKGVGGGWFSVVSPRDFAGYSGHVKEVGDDGKARYYYLQTTRDFDDVPEQSGYVRGETSLAGWVLEEPEEKGGQVKVTYIVKFDPRGSIPTALLSTIAKELPLCISRVGEFLSSKGYAPHMHQHDEFPGQLRLEALHDLQEERNPETGELISEAGQELEVSWVGEPGKFSIYFDEAFWKNGAKVVVGDGKVPEEFEIGTGEGKVTITVKEEGKGKALRVLVSKA